MRDAAPAAMTSGVKLRLKKKQKKTALHREAAGYLTVMTQEGNVTKPKKAA